MKKKLVVFITALVMVFACALGLVACGGFDDGTYTAYALTVVDGEKVAHLEGEMTFKDGKVTADGEEVGTYKADGDKLTVTIEGVPMTFTEKDDMWQFSVAGNGMAFCKKGSTPKGYKVQGAESDEN